jgi:hypothetical protein
MTDRLTILLTNVWLTHRAGSETVVRDLALGLLRRGHRPIVYSPALGPPAEEIAARGVCVIDDLRNLAEPPDIIHAHHSVPCGEALICFPQTPAIYVCHAFTLWMEAPVYFPQIGAYVAIDEACRDRLVHSAGVPPGHVTVVHNAVDLGRIPPRPQPLRARPERVLAFGKASVMPEVRIACERLGIEYQALGIAADRVVAHPEAELVNFDLVFGSARAALEAMCCGCAAIACDFRGSAGLVTSQNFDRLRAQNFGLRCLSEPVTVDGCVREIGRYDPIEAARVARRARDEADLEKTLDRFESLYAEVLTGARRPRITSDGHERAVGRFLHTYLPRRPADPRWPWLAEKEHLEAEVRALQTKVGQLTEELERGQAGARAFADSAAERDQIEVRLDTIQVQLAAIVAEPDQTKDRLAAAATQLARTTDERDRLQRALGEVSGQLNDLKKSRFLRLGRVLRAMAGRPIPY